LKHFSKTLETFPKTAGQSWKSGRKWVFLHWKNGNFSAKEP
jgi:hypothetical protein